MSRRGSLFSVPRWSLFCLPLPSMDISDEFQKNRGGINLAAMALRRRSMDQPACVVTVRNARPNNRSHRRALCATAESKRSTPQDKRKTAFGPPRDSGRKMAEGPRFSILAGSLIASRAG